uniref:G protein-coupled receptor n=1 Tax=Haemonchus contortus TaxID=6289 RepID=A0A7I4Y349_HAECO
MVSFDTITYHLYGDIFFIAPTFIPTKNSPYLINHFILSIIQIIDLIAVVFSLPVVLLHNYCLTKSAIFHPNLVRIAQVYLSGNYFAIISRLTTHLYQVGVLHFDDRNNCLKILLFIVSIIRSYFLMSTVVFLVEVIIERTFAFYFVVDYEKKPRLWISTGILAATLPLTFLVTIMMLIRIIPIKIIIIADCVMTMLFLIIFVVLYRLNVLRLHELRAGMAHSKTKNTLSIKFQLLENVKVMRLVMIAFSVGSILTFIGIGLFALALLVYYDQPEARQLCLVLLDLLVALSTAVGFFAFLLIFNEWRQAIGEWPLALKLCHILRIQLNEPCQSIDDHRGATDHYFNQLRQAWE